MDIDKSIIPVPCKDFRILGFATGDYLCNCHICKTNFVGDKRASTCLPCVIKLVEEKIKSTNTSSLAIVLPDFDIVEKRVVASLIQEGYDSIDISVARRTHTIIGEILQEQRQAGCLNQRKTKNLHPTTATISKP